MKKFFTTMYDNPSLRVSASPRPRVFSNQEGRKKVAREKGIITVYPNLILLTNEPWNRLLACFNSELARCQFQPEFHTYFTP